MVVPMPKDVSLEDFMKMIHEILPDAIWEEGTSGEPGELILLTNYFSHGEADLKRGPERKG